jgi:glycosyltransferase involved in cell wall biosynthesis
MNTIIHIVGILGKYALLNLKAVFLCAKKKSKFETLNIKRIVFTHNLGGGTEVYVRSHFIDRTTLIVRLISYRSDSIYSLENVSDKIVFPYKKVKQILSKVVPEEIIVNSINAYSDPSRIFKLIESIKTKKITYLVHDYHCVCNTGMFIYNNRYCEMKCESCHIGHFMTARWRPMWNDFFNHVDEIVCFSRSSKGICLKFYPALINKIKIIPHSMEYCKFQPIKLTGNNIGIIGNCSNIAKGKKVINNLRKYLEGNKKYKLILIGKSPTIFRHESSSFHCTGSYNVDRLPDYLESNQIGLCLFTSVWPETFSYAVSELMMLDVPIVSVALGAQGEKLINYDKGYFIDNLEPCEIVRFADRFFTEYNTRG